MSWSHRHPMPDESFANFARFITLCRLLKHLNHLAFLHALSMLPKCFFRKALVLSLVACSIFPSYLARTSRIAGYVRDCGRCTAEIRHMRAQFRPLGAHLLKAQGCPEMPSMHDKPMLTCDRFLLKAVTEQLMPQDPQHPSAHSPSRTA